jgi:AraC-like DNA-binding protein
MMRENLYQPFEIGYKRMDRFPATTYHNNYFTLIYIAEGTGQQFTNNHHFNYRKGNLFLITPEDSYSFTIETTTQFFLLSFQNRYIKPKAHQDNDWVQRMEFILQNASHRPGCILKNKVDKPMVATLIESIVKENDHQQLYHNKVIQQMVNTLIIVVARNIALKLPKNVKENTGEPVLDILQYIQQHIYDPEKLKAPQICKQLGISLHYLGRYFKHQTGETLQQYITHYKMRLIENKLLYTDMRIGEIATELCFTDESHMNRSFKKWKGMSPTAYRKKFLPVATK